MVADEADSEAVVVVGIAAVDSVVAAAAAVAVPGGLVAGVEAAAEDMKSRRTSMFHLTR